MKYNTVKSEVYFLRMEDKPKLITASRADITLNEVLKPIDTTWYKKLYLSVGEELNWLDRIFMNEEELSNKINSASTHIFTFLIDKKHAGYCELVEDNKEIEILYFGLIPAFVGKGYGKYLLHKTIELAWSYSPSSVKLNTCDLDHPNALSTYKKAGFKWYKTIIEEKKVRID